MTSKKSIKGLAFSSSLFMTTVLGGLYGARTAQAAIAIGTVPLGSDTYAVTGVGAGTYGSTVTIGTGNYTGSGFGVDTSVTTIGYVKMISNGTPAVIVTGDGLVQVRDKYNSYLNSTGGTALVVKSVGDDGSGTNGAILVNVNGSIVGNYGHGIYAVNYVGSSGGIEINVNAGTGGKSVPIIGGSYNAVVAGSISGVYANNHGLGDLVITTGDTVFVGGLNASAIDARSSYNSGKVTVDIGKNSVIQTGYGNGILVQQSGTGGTYVHVGQGAKVDASNSNFNGGDAIAIHNKLYAGAGDVYVKTDSYATVTGFNSGIWVDNQTDGSSTKVVTGDHSKTYGNIWNGISVKNGGYNYINSVSYVNQTGVKDVSVTTGDYSVTHAQGDGINVYNAGYGSSSVVVGANATVEGGLSGGGGRAKPFLGDGVRVNHFGGGDLTVTTLDYAKVVGIHNGIAAHNYGYDNKIVIKTGANSKTYGGSGYAGIRANDGDPSFAPPKGGPFAYGQGGDIKITTGYQSIVKGGQGISVDNEDAGNAYVKTGDYSVTQGTALNNGNGINVYNGYSDYTMNVTVITGASSTVEATVNGDGINVKNNDATGTTDVTVGNGVDAYHSKVTGVGAGNNGIRVNHLGTGHAQVVVGDYADVLGDNNGVQVFSYNPTTTLGEGDIIVTTGNYATVTGTNGVGIEAQIKGLYHYSESEPFTDPASTTAKITITNGDNATIKGKQSGINAGTYGGDIIINNTGSYARITNSQIGNSHDEKFNAINTSDNGVLGGNTVTVNDTGNYADIVGQIHLNGNGMHTMHIGSTSAWITEGDNWFGNNDTSSNAIVNDGYLVAGNHTGVLETTQINGLQTFTNNYEINLHDQSKGDGTQISDHLYISGNFVGALSSHLKVDSFLGAPGSKSDVLEIGGDSSGATVVNVTDTNPGPGSYNPTGILVVQVDDTSHVGDFKLPGAPIDKGLFRYDLLRKNDGNFYLISAPDREVFETLATISGAQTLWHESEGAWSSHEAQLRDGGQCAPKPYVKDDLPDESCANNRNIWLTALGSWTNSNRTSTFTLPNNLATYTYDTSYNQDVYGIVMGADFGSTTSDGTKMLFGVMGGFQSSNLNFKLSSTSISTSGGTVGAYASLLKDGFFADALVKGDFSSMSYSAPSLMPFGSTASTDIQTLGARGDIGYRMGSNAMFVEPMISASFTSTSVGDFSLGGSTFHTSSSGEFLAGAGARVGLASDKFSAAVTGRIWDKVSGTNSIDVISGGAPLTVSDSGLMSGVFGEVGGDITAQVSGNASLQVGGDVKFDGQTTTATAKGGLTFSW